MYSGQSDSRGRRSTRRTLLRRVAAVGAAGALAGCVGGDSASATSGGADGSADATATESPTPAPTTGDSGADGAASFDCGSIPTSLSAFEPTDVSFSFACDAPPRPSYGVETAEDTVQRVAQFYFSRDGVGSINDWDFNVELSEFVDTAGSADRIAPKATEAFSIEYAGETVPVRHQAITDDQDMWVFGLPEDGEFRLVTVGSAVMPGRFGCHETVRGIARAVVQSIRPL